MNQQAARNVHGGTQVLMAEAAYALQGGRNEGTGTEGWTLARAEGACTAEQARKHAAALNIHVHDKGKQHG